MAAALDAEPAEETADEDEPRTTRATTTATDEDAEKPRRARRRGAAAAAARAAAPASALEGTFDHGEEGYGLWLDPAVQDDPVYAEHWAGHRPVTVTIEADRSSSAAPARSRRRGRRLTVPRRRSPA